MNNIKNSMFPIYTSLVSTENKKVVKLYMNFLFSVREIVNNVKITNMLKIQQLNEIEDIFLSDKKSQKYNNIVELKKEFVKKLLVPALVKDVITAAKKDAANFEYETWGQLMDYYSKLSGTVARFFMALNDENPATYLPAAELFSAYNILYYLAGLKHRLQTNKRVYMPKEMMDDFDINFKSFFQHSSHKSITKATNEMIVRAKKMLKESKILPSIVKSFKLRMQVAAMILLTNIMARRLKNKNLMKRNIKIYRVDCLNAYITAFFVAMLTTYKESGTRGLKV